MDKHLDKKHLVRAELMKDVRQLPFRLVSYSEFGRRVGIAPQGPWKYVLGAIADEEHRAGRPDVTWILINKLTKVSGWLKEKPMTISEKQEFMKNKIQEIIDYHNKAAKNPYV